MRILSKLRAWLLYKLGEGHQYVTVQELERLATNVNSSPQVVRGWYKTQKGSWCYLEPFFVYLGDGKILWATHLRSGMTKYMGAVACKLISERELTYIEPMEIKATHPTSLITTNCPVCGLSPTEQSYTPCFHPKKSK